MQTDLNVYGRMGNPYAKLANMEEDLPPDGISAAIRMRGNQYAKLSMLDDEESVENPVRAVRQGVFEFLPTASDAHLAAEVQRPGMPETRHSISRADFTTACRSIFAQYEPLQSGRKQLRPEFRKFISVNGVKSPEARAKIISELERYDLSKMGGIQPHLNREHEASLLKKLAAVAAVAE